MPHLIQEQALLVFLMGKNAHSMSDSLLWIQLGPILLLPCGFGIGIYPAYSCPDTSAIRSALGAGSRRLSIRYGTDSIS